MRRKKKTNLSNKKKNPSNNKYQLHRGEKRGKEKKQGRNNFITRSDAAPINGWWEGTYTTTTTKKKAEKERHEKNGEGSHTNRVGRMQKKKKMS